MPHPDNIDSDDIAITRVQAGELSAFESLLDRHLGSIRAFVALKLPVPHLVDEIAHETFVFAYRHIAEFMVGTSFRSWLRAIAWNLARAELQRFGREQINQSRYAEARLAECSRSSINPWTSPEAEYLEDCMRRVPEGSRKLLEMKYREGRSTEEMASALGRTLEWVRITLFRIRQQLRSCIEARMEGGSHAG